MDGKQKQDKIDKKNEKLPADRINKVADKRYNNIEFKFTIGIAVLEKFSSVG